MRLNTAAGVRKLAAPDPSGKQVVYSSVEQQGLQMVVSGSTTVRSWAVQGNLNGKTLRIFLGPVSANCDGEEIARFQRKAQEFRELMRMGLDPRAEMKRRAAKQKAEGITIGELWEAHRKTPRWAKLRLSTRDLYELSWRTCLSELADEAAIDLRLADVSAAHARWVERRGYALPRLAIIVLRGIWKSGKLLGLLDRMAPSPVEGINDLSPGWAAIPVRVADISDDELPRFWLALNSADIDPITRMLVKFLMFTGLRSSEARYLRWDEVDLDRGLIRLPPERVKTKRELVLPLSKPTLEILRELQAMRERGSLRFGVKKDHVFGLADAQMDRRHPELFEILRKLREEAGIKDKLTTHVFRKVFGRIAETTVGLGSTKRLLNHSVKADVTLSHYSLRSLDQLRSASEAVSEEILRLVRPKLEVVSEAS